MFVDVSCRLLSEQGGSFVVGHLKEMMEGGREEEGGERGREGERWRR